MTEREIQDLFREMREEPVPADSLARVRLGVEKRAVRRNWWKFAVPVAVSACLVAGFLLLRPVNKPMPIEQTSTPEIAQVVIPPPELPVPAAQTAPRPKRVRPRPQRVEVAPVSIRIETPDPDVVILLVN